MLKKLVDRTQSNGGGCHSCSGRAIRNLRSMIETCRKELNLPEIELPGKEFELNPNRKRRRRRRRYQGPPPAPPAS